jgi:hypothetical protein
VYEKIDIDGDNEEATAVLVSVAITNKIETNNYGIELFSVEREKLEERQQQKQYLEKF